MTQLLRTKRTARCWHRNHRYDHSKQGHFEWPSFTGLTIRLLRKIPGVSTTVMEMHLVVHHRYNRYNEKATRRSRSDLNHNKGSRIHSLHWPRGGSSLHV